ncbi:MAG: hypothetical protein ACRCU3_10365 [Eubacteriaceae bacterium]
MMKNSEDANKKSTLKKLYECFVIGICVAIIFVLLFLKPLYLDYEKNGELLNLKHSLTILDRENLTEEEYLGKIEVLGEKNREAQKIVPDVIEANSIYEKVLALAENAEVDIVMIEFEKIEETKDEKFLKMLELSGEAWENQWVLSQMGVHLKLIGDTEKQGRFLENFVKLEPLVVIKKMTVGNGLRSDVETTIFFETYALKESGVSLINMDN